MSGVRILHILKDWFKFIQIHQYYTMALIYIINSLTGVPKITQAWVCGGCVLYQNQIIVNMF